jgi:hypothetical protein
MAPTCIIAVAHPELCGQPLLASANRRAGGDRV